jgi:MFS family permease
MGGRGVSYLGELRQNARPLLGASLGIGTSLPLFAYTNSVFAPFLISEFHWSRAQFALVGLTMLVTLPFFPIIGRVTDRIGVRRVALAGTVLTLPGIIAYSQMSGSFTQYLVIFTYVLIVASMTSTLTYTRVVAENFERATGLALTIVNCVPAVLAIPVIPLLNWTIEHIGWRTSYVILGVFCFISGLTAIVLIPSSCHKEDEPAPAPQETRRSDYAVIVRSKVFWIILVAMFLCLLQTQLHSSQMNVMLIDQGLTKQAAAGIASVYAFGTIVGRIACGLALDRWSTPIVTAVSMFFPAIGFFLLGTPINTWPVIAFSMFLVGLTVGAESDVISFLIARYFKLRIYNTTLSLVFCCSFLASAVGAIGVSWSLGHYNSFEPFLFVIAGSITIGCLLFLLLPRTRGFAKIG